MLEVGGSKPSPPTKFDHLDPCSACLQTSWAFCVVQSLLSSDVWADLAGTWTAGGRAVECGFGTGSRLRRSADVSLEQLASGRWVAWGGGVIAGGATRAEALASLGSLLDEHPTTRTRRSGRRPTTRPAT